MKPEVNGALAIKGALPRSRSDLPDNFSNLRRRLEARRTEPDRRAFRDRPPGSAVRAQLRLPDLINEQAHPEVAVEDLESIVRAERFRIHRLPDNRIKELEDT
jgi:hypothetical protein